MATSLDLPTPGPDVTTSRRGLESSNRASGTVEDMHCTYDLLFYTWTWICMPMIIIAYTIC